MFFVFQRFTHIRQSFLRNAQTKKISLNILCLVYHQILLLSTHKSKLFHTKNRKPFPDFLSLCAVLSSGGDSVVNGPRFCYLLSCCSSATFFLFLFLHHHVPAREQLPPEINKIKKTIAHKSSITNFSFHRQGMLECKILP